MDKFAQSKRWKHRLRRNIDLSGRALRSLWDPEFRQLVEELDLLDQTIRKESEELNFYIRTAQTFATRSDYLSAATYLVRLHSQVRRISNLLNNFNKKTNLKHKQFILKQFPESKHKDLFDYDLDKAAANFKHSVLISEGIGRQDMGREIWDWWKAPGSMLRPTNLWSTFFNDKTKSMRGLESKFDIPFLKQLREDTRNHIKLGKDFLTKLYEILDDFGSAWSKRNVGEYIKTIGRFNGIYEPYDKAFKKYYTDNIIPMKQEQEEMAQEEKAKRERENVKTPAAPQVPQSPLNQSRFAPKSAPVPDLDFQQPSAPKPQRPPNPFLPQQKTVLRHPVSGMPVPPSNWNPAWGSPDTSNIDKEWENVGKTTMRGMPAAKPVARNLEIVPEEDEDNIPFELNRRSYQEFIDGLEKSGSLSESAQQMLEYAAQLEEEGNSEESLKLLAIAEGIIEKVAIEPPKKTRKKKDPSQIEESIEEEDPNLQREQGAFEPLDHGIPFGMEIGQRWFNIPYLANLSPDKLQFSSSSANHIFRKVHQFLFNKFILVDPRNGELLLSLIKEALTKGLLVSNLACGGTSNERDCSLNVFSYIRLGSLEDSLAGKILKFTCTCRLAISNNKKGVITIHDIKDMGMTAEVGKKASDKNNT